MKKELGGTVSMIVPVMCTAMGFGTASRRETKNTDRPGYNEPNRYSRNGERDVFAKLNHEWRSMAVTMTVMITGIVSMVVRMIRQCTRPFQNKERWFFALPFMRSGHPSWGRCAANNIWLPIRWV